MTVNLTVDYKRLLFLLAVLVAVGAYKVGYSRGESHMARVAAQYLESLDKAPETAPLPGADPFHELPGSSIK